MAPITRAWPLARCTVTHWTQDNAATFGAALAFYCAFSLAPLLVILVTITGWIVGEELAYGQLRSQLNALFGAGTAQVALKAMHTSQTANGIAATVLSVGTLVIGATTVFSALETALQQIWGASAMRPRGIAGWFRARVISFGVILAIGFLLLVSLSISTALTSLREIVAERYSAVVVVTAALDIAVTLALITGLIALIYRYLPAKRMAWRPILWGALVTALLFQLGRWAVGLYLSRSTQPSAFGAAASFVALLLWLYYTAQIFLLGAEFTACLGGTREPKSAKARREAGR